MFDSKKLDKILKTFPAFNQYVIAFSGGLDSSVLLHAIAQIIDKKKLRAIHINHGWHRDAMQWAQHCQFVCKNLDVVCELITIDAKPKSGESPEAYARTERYAALTKLINTNDCLFTAHQQDDQAETLLIQLLRGAGVSGLAGMPLITAFSEGYHARPLLHFSRDEIMDYAKQHKLTWIEDDSNQNTKYNRNFIRHVILPEIKKRWPSAAVTLSRVAKHCSETKKILMAQAETDLACIQHQENKSLSIKKLLDLDEARRNNVIRYWLQQLNFSIPSEAQLKQIHNAILFGKKEANPKINWDNVEIRRYQNHLFALKKREKWDTEKVISWDDLTQPLSIPGLGILSAKSLEEQGINLDYLKNAKTTVRFRQGGERCQPLGRQGSHPLKKLFQEWKIPPWERDRVPLIYCDDALVAIVNYCICEKNTIS